MGGDPCEFDKNLSSCRTGAIPPQSFVCSVQQKLKEVEHGVDGGLQEEGGWLFGNSLITHSCRSLVRRCRKEKERKTEHDDEIAQHP
ncbi:hypothetical protein CBR_g34682 [Chara braunii]|uniref:Uncharacterized protein n=1 Tax=Chara braunii TaxID=69332 RepID=A0A388JYT7_CHABU|nr:hypothetical protein CBR_g34682 [Chara braunii]|eukprot:GBG62981.1 hypothetical protein CBR_g34682 [Chara braunii]